MCIGPFLCTLLKFWPTLSRTSKMPGRATSANFFTAGASAMLSLELDFSCCFLKTSMICSSSDQSFSETLVFTRASMNSKKPCFVFGKARFSGCSVTLPLSPWLWSST